MSQGYRKENPVFLEAGTRPRVLGVGVLWRADGSVVAFSEVNGVWLMPDDRTRVMPAAGDRVEISYANVPPRRDD